MPRLIFGVYEVWEEKKTGVKQAKKNPGKPGLFKKKQTIISSQQGWLGMPLSPGKPVWHPLRELPVCFR